MSINGEEAREKMDLPPPELLTDLLEKAREISKQTRELINKALEQPFSYELKEDNSFVTDIDLAVERKIRTALNTSFPSHSIVGEELPSQTSSSDYQWIIDPIDGTHSLRHRLPLFGTILALRYRGAPVLGLIDLPGINRCYSGATGLGAWCDGRRLKVRDLEEGEMLEREIISVGDRVQFLKAGRTEALDRLLRAHLSVRSYCDCFGHCMVLEGSLGAMLDPGLRIWDVVASVVLAREAGCKFCWLKSDDEARLGGCYDVVFGKPAVVDWLVDLWNESSIS